VSSPVALSIAGSDPSAGAGIQADLKTFTTLGVYGAAVVTALTAQSAHGVDAVAAVDATFVTRQLSVVLEALPVAAAKTGMLHRAEVVAAVADLLGARPLPALVVDPVMVATSGAVLLERDALSVLRDRLLPLATLLTPNLDEAEALSGRAVRSPAAMAEAARALVDRGARAVLVTGGHLPGDAVDVLYDGQAVHVYRGARVGGPSRHGTGCALSAAITARLAHGDGLHEAIATAKEWVARALAGAGGRGLDFAAPVR
jgi:hydroxymethylpyrimidine kinase/phosphomethylpyrimidine kinase